MRFLAWIGFRSRLVWAAALVLGLAAGAWIGISQTEAGGLQARQPGELAERESLKQSVRVLLEANKFSALERMASYFRSSGVRTAGGVWKLTIFYDAFHEIAGSIAAADEKGWKQFSARLADWQGQFADGPTAAVVQGIAAKSYAWSVRPRRFVLETSTGADARFVAALANARSVLDHGKPQAANDPEFYVLRVQIGTALGEAPDQVMALLSEGRDRFPDYFALDFPGLDYFAAGDGLHPPGAEEAERVEAFARTAAAQAPAGEQDERYARLYWHAYQVVYGGDLFGASRVDWPRMRAGLEAIGKRYRDAWNLNNFAHFACLAGDRATARQLIASLPGRPLGAVWQARSAFAACQHWATLEPEARR